MLCILNGFGYYAVGPLFWRVMCNNRQQFLVHRHRNGTIGIAWFAIFESGRNNNDLKIVTVCSVQHLQRWLAQTKPYQSFDVCERIIWWMQVNRFGVWLQGDAFIVQLTHEHIFSWAHIEPASQRTSAIESNKLKGVDNNRLLTWKSIAIDCGALRFPQT